MRQIYSGKQIKDRETASESLINNSLLNKAVRSLSNSTVKMTVTSHLESDHQIDDYGDKKNRKRLGTLA